MKPITFHLRTTIFVIFFLQTSYLLAQLVTCSVNAGAAGEWCSGDTIRLDGNISGLIQPGTVQWTQTGGAPVTIINPNSLKAKVAPPAAGLYTFKISAVCSQGMAEQTVTHTALDGAIPDAGPDQTILCYTGGGVPLTGFNLPPAGISSYWSSPYGYIVGTTFYPDTLQIGNCGPNGGWFYVDYNFINSKCSKQDRKYIQITNYVPEPKILLQGGCGNNYNIIGTCPGNGTIMWEFLSPVGGAGATFSNPTNINSDIINLSNNQEYIIRYSINSPCGLVSVIDTFVANLGEGLTGFSPSSNYLNFCNSPENIVLSPPQAPDTSKNEYGYWFQKSDCFTYGGFPSLLSPINNSDWSSTSITLTGFIQFSRYLVVYRLFRDGCYQDYEVRIQIDGILENKKYIFDGSCGLHTIPFDTICHRSIVGMHNFYFPFIYIKCGNGGFVHYYNSIFNSLPLISPPNGDTTRIKFSNQNDGPSCRGHYLVLSPSAPNGTYLYEGSYTNSCGTFKSEVQIEISMPPVPTNAGTDQFICATSTSLAGNSVGNPNWYFLSKFPSGANTPIIQGDSTKTLGINNLSPDAEYRFVYRSWGGAYCESSFDTVVVHTASSPPNQPIAGNDINGCFGAEITLSSTPDPFQPGTIGTWSLVSQNPLGSTPLIDQPQSPSTIVQNTLANTTYTFRYTVQNGCGSASDDIVVNTGNTEGPNPPNAGLDQCLLSGTSATTMDAMAAAPVGALGMWTEVPGNPPGAIIGDVAIPNTGISGLIDGTYRFVWNATKAPCGTISDTVVVTVGAVGIADIPQTEIEVCNQAIPATIALQASAINAGTGIWSIEEGIPGAVIANPTSNLTSVSGLLPGTYRFRWTVDNGACGGGSDEVIVRVGDVPPIVNVGNDTTLCPGSDGLITLNGTPPGNFAGYWSVVNVAPGQPSEGVTFVQNTTASQYNAIVRANPGRTRLRWTLLPSAPCSDMPSVDDILIDYVPPATLPNDTLKLCNATALNLVGENPGLSGTGVWTQISGTSIANLPQVQEDNNPIVINLSGGVGTYQFLYTISSTACPISTDSLTVINYPQPPFPSAGADDTLCVKDEILLTGSLPPTGYTVTWSIQSGPTPAWQAQFLPNIHSQNATFKPVQNGVYVFVYTISNDGCTLQDAVVDSVQISTVNAGPDRLLCDDTSISLGSAGPGQTWLAAPGNPSLAVVDPASGIVNGIVNEGIYTFQISEGNGCYDLVRVTKTLAIQVNQQPIGDTVCIGGMLNLGISGMALQGVLQYQWQSATAANGPFGNIFGATGPSYSPSSGSAVTAFYRVLLSSTANACKDTSLVVPVQVVPDQSISIQPQNIAACEGTPILLTAAAIGGVPPLSYQWQSATSAGGPWTDISGANNSSFIPLAIPGTTYYRMAANAVGSGCTTANTIPATVTVDAAIAINAEPQSIVECEGGNGALSVSTSGIGISYQWQSGPSAAGPFTNVGTNQSSYVPQGTIPGTTYYLVQISSTNNLCKDTSLIVPVQVVPDQTISVQPQNISACEGTPIQLAAMASGGIPPLNYQWQSSNLAGGPWTDIPGANNTTLDLASIPGTVYYQMIATTSGSGCSNANTNPATVTIDAAISINAEPQSIVECEGGNEALMVSTSGTGISYQWQSGPSASGPFTNVGSNQATYSPLGTVLGTVFYRVQIISTNNLCTDTSVIVTATVVEDQNIIIQPIPTSDCIGAPITLNADASGGIVPLSYQWQIADSPIGPWINVPNGTTPTLSVNTSISDSAYYQLVVSSAGTGCGDAISNPALIQIGPSLALSQQPQDISECVGGQDILSIVITGSGTPTIQWQFSNDGGITWSNIPGANAANYMPSSSQNNSASLYRAVIDDPFSPCGRDTSIAAVVVINTIFSVADTIEVCNFADGINNTLVNFGNLVIAGDPNSNWQSIDGANPVGTWSQKDFTGVPEGTYRFVATTTNATGPCINVQDTVVVIVNLCCPLVCTTPPPSVLCNESASTFYLDNLLCQGSQPGFWAIVSGPGISTPVPVVGGQFQANGQLPGDYTVLYQLIQSPSACPQSSAQTLQIAQAPNAGLSIGNTDLCQNADTILPLTNLLTNEDLGGFWSSANVPGANLNASTGALNTSGLVPGTYAAQYVLSTLGCPNDTAEVTLNILPIPFIDASPNVLLTCDSSTVVIGNIQNGQGVGESVYWSATDGGIVLDSNASQFVTGTPGTYFLQIANTISGCMSLDTVRVGIGEAFITGMEAEISLPTCHGDNDASIQVLSISGGTAPFVYTIRSAQDTLSNGIGHFGQLSAGQYTLELQDANGCVNYRDYVIEDPTLIELKLLSDTIIGCGDSMRLTIATNATPSDVYSLRWYAFSTLLDTSGIYNKVVYPLESTSYSIRLQDKNGCVVEDRATVEVDNVAHYYAPNVFTPNEDGQNDLFKLFFSEKIDHIYTFQVFDRWGNLMYRKDDFLPDDVSFGWDGWHRGKIMDPAVFVWFAEIGACYGGKILIKGDVTIVR